MLAGINGTGGLASGIRRLAGVGGGSSGNDPFQEYLQLLQSSRLAAELAQKDNLLPVIFYKRWDAQNERWKEPGVLSNVISSIKKFLHQPVTQHPDSDALQDYLSKNFDVSSANTGRGLAALTGPNYMVASLQFTDHDKTATILNTILRRADEIIRQEQLRDVDARIAYIKSELPNVTQAEQREALIETLSEQEELQIMMVADQRYASTMIDVPHVDPKPTFPPSPLSALVSAAFWSVVLWVGIVAVESRSRLVRRATWPFRSLSRREVGTADRKYA
jgi:hypothetical protein